MPAASLLPSSPSQTPALLPSEILAISTTQWLFPPSALLHTPSILAGLTPQQERTNRRKATSFILAVGIALKLPQPTIYTASVYLHRFFMRYPMEVPTPHPPPSSANGSSSSSPAATAVAAPVLSQQSLSSTGSGAGGSNTNANTSPAAATTTNTAAPPPTPPVQSYHYYSAAAIALFLALKVCETARKMREVVVACVRVAQHNATAWVDEQDREYWRWKDTILAGEDVLLEALCFDLSVESPYEVLGEFLGRLGVCNGRRGEDEGMEGTGKGKKVRNASWAFVNDGVGTGVCLVAGSRAIAAASIFVGARVCGVRLEDGEGGEAWWEVLGLGKEEVLRAVEWVVEGYEGMRYEGCDEGGMEETRERKAGSELTNGQKGDEEGRIKWERSGSAERNGEAANGVEAPAENGGDGENNGPSVGVASQNSNADANADTEEPARKRQRVESNGNGNGSNGDVEGSRPNADAATDADANGEDVSEEGEVEP